MTGRVAASESESRHRSDRRRCRVHGVLVVWAAAQRQQDVPVSCGDSGSGGK